MYHWVWIYPLGSKDDLLVNDRGLDELKKKYGSKVHVLKSSNNKEDLR